MLAVARVDRGRDQTPGVPQTSCENRARFPSAFATILGDPVNTAQGEHLLSISYSEGNGEALVLLTYERVAGGIVGNRSPADSASLLQRWESDSGP